MKFNGTYGEEMSVDGEAFVFWVENTVEFAEFGGDGGYA